MQKLNTTGSLWVDNLGNIFSYDTCIKTWDTDGKDIGNVTRYSSTTSKHQNQMNIDSCKITVDGLKSGALPNDLREAARKKMEDTKWEENY